MNRTIRPSANRTEAERFEMGVQNIVGLLTDKAEDIRRSASKSEKRQAATPSPTRSVDLSAGQQIGAGRLGNIRGTARCLRLVPQFPLQRGIAPRIDIDDWHMAE